LKLNTNFSYFDFIALINFLLRLSALAFCKEITAQTAAGIQPIKVICKIKQIIPVSILPRSRNEINGKKMAIKVMF
jgi:hypothetical protein